jgi:hypothetical protein
MNQHLDAVIDALLHARELRGASDATPVLVRAVPTADDAYLVQAAQANELDWFADGPPRHWKSGGASRSAAMTHAPLPPAGVWSSPADARDWPFRMRFIEAEVALRLGRDVTADDAADLDMASAAAFIDAMAVSIEIVDSRWQQGFSAPALLRLADLQSHGALVLGAWQPYVARDWAAQPCHVEIGEKSFDFRGTHSCGDPAWVLPEWLRHATREGDTLPAGSVVTTGTWCGALEALRGDRVRVAFAGIGEAEVQL